MLLGDRQRGLAVALAGTLAISPDAVCVRWLVESGVSLYSVLFWTLFFCGAVMGTFAMAARGPMGAARGLTAGGRLAVLAVLLQMGNFVGFTVALATTSAAHTILLVDLNPLWTVLLGRIFLGESVAPRTKKAMAAALVAVTVIFLPQLLPPHILGSGPEKRVTLLGDAIAVGTGVCLASFITVVRYAARVAPEADMTSAAFVGAILAAFSCLAVAPQNTVFAPRQDGYASHRPLSHFYLVAAADGFSVGSLNIALSIAPALCPGPEIGLILLLNAIIAPIWIFLGFGDRPGTFTLVGGGLLVLTLALHELAASQERGGPVDDKGAEEIAITQAAARPVDNKMRGTNDDDDDDDDDRASQDDDHGRIPASLTDDPEEALESPAAGKKQQRRTKEREAEETKTPKNQL